MLLELRHLSPRNIKIIVRRHGVTVSLCVEGVVTLSS